MYRLDLNRQRLLLPTIAALSLSLLPAPVARAAPDPTIVEITANELSVSVDEIGKVGPGQTVWFKVKAANSGTVFQGHGGIGISVPGYGDVADVAAENMELVQVVAAGEPLPGAEGAGLAEHVMVYAERDKWKPGEEASLAVAVQVPLTGTVDFLVRIAFMNYNWTPMALEPAAGEATTVDQQGYGVHVIRLAVDQTIAYCDKECADQQAFDDSFDGGFYGTVSTNGLWRKTERDWLCKFVPSQVEMEGGRLLLEVPEGGEQCAEIASHSSDFYYGSYRVVMRPSDVPGVCAAFFMFNSDVQEIDVEILSKDDDESGRVHFVTQPSGGLGCGSPAHKCHDMATKPSDGFHEYGFDWYPDRVEFFVDGEMVELTTSNVPKFPGHLIVSNWAGNPEWTGPVPRDEAVLEVVSVSYTPFDYCPVCAGCGNDLVTADEECDGGLLDGQTCQGFGFAQGQVTCDAGCQLDSSGCFGSDPCLVDPGAPECGPPCGNGIQQPGEECDGGLPAALSCQALGWDSGELSCTSDCTVDISDCTTEVACGDGLLDPGEECDRQDLGGATCASLGFAGGGVLACTLECTLQTAACVSAKHECGNGELDGGEECDWAQLKVLHCSDFGYDQGSAHCLLNCQWDLTDCSHEFPERPEHKEIPEPPGMDAEVVEPPEGDTGGGFAVGTNVPQVPAKVQPRPVPDLREPRQSSAHCAAASHADAGSLGLLAWLLAAFVSLRLFSRRRAAHSSGAF